MKLAEAEFRAIAHEWEHGDWTSIYRAFAARLVECAENQIGDKLARLVDPHDVVQSAFRTLLRRVRDPGGFMSLPPGTDLWRLLLVITLNKIRKAGNFHRAAKRSIDRTRSLVGNEAVPDARDGDLDLAILRMTLEEHLDRLDTLRRRMLVLYLRGRSLDEIAEQTGRSPRTVYRAVTAFQESLEPLLDDV